MEDQVQDNRFRHPGGLEMCQCHRLVFAGVCIALLFAAAPAWATTWVDTDRTIAIDPLRGADRKVDYASLVRIGPWDDRNYRLTEEDLAYLPANESDPRSPLPVFFRVAFRRELEKQGYETLSHDPMSALNEFRQRFGGYQIDGKYYGNAVWRDDQYFISLESMEEAGDQDSVDVRYEVRVTSPNGASTSAVAISPVDTQKLVASTNGPNERQRLHYSHNGGSTWTETEVEYFHDWPHGGTPTVEWSSDGQFAYTVLLGGCGETCLILFYRSDDDGVTWTSLETEPPGSPRRLIAEGTSGEYRLHVDQYETSPHKDNIYVTYRDMDGRVMQLGRSKSFGDRWSEHSFSNAPLGKRGDVSTDRAGDVYYAWIESGTQEIYVSKSTNGGASFGDAVNVASRNGTGFLPIPILTNRVPDSLFADTDTSNGPYADSVYLVWIDSTGPYSPVPTENHGRIQVAYSRDGGTTWTVTTPHETSDHLTVDRWQPFIAVGENGVVHVIFNDTRRSGDRLSMDVFYSYSTDGAQTWSVPERVTSEMSPKIDDWSEFGAYSGLDIVMEDLVAIFTDNRHEGGGTGDSVDIYAAGITPGGSSIGAGRIPGARGVPGSPLTLARLETGELQLAWSPVCGAGDDYAVYEGTIGFFDEKGLVQCSTAGATTTTLAASAGDVFYLVVATSDGSAEGSYGRASDGSERSPSQAACFPRIIGTCP